MYHNDRTDRCLCRGQYSVVQWSWNWTFRTVHVDRFISRTRLLIISSPRRIIPDVVWGPDFWPGDFIKYRWFSLGQGSRLRLKTHRQLHQWGLKGNPSGLRTPLGGSDSSCCCFFYCMTIRGRTARVCQKPPYAVWCILSCNVISPLFIAPRGEERIARYCALWFSTIWIWLYWLWLRVCFFLMKFMDEWCLCVWPHRLTMSWQ